MKHQYSAAELALYRAVDEVLHYKWDPIGVSGIPEARDEYNSYVPEVIKLLQEMQCEKTITELLRTITTERMGLTLHQERDNAVAQLLLDWQRFIQEQLASQKG